MQFFKKIEVLIDVVEAAEEENIRQAVELISQTIQEKRSVFIFGASHAGILAQEMYYRAGGLALFNPIFAEELMLNVEPILHTSRMEQFPGYGTILAKRVPAKPGDVVIVHSVSGRNPVALDLVMELQKLPVKVIAITNVAYSSATSSRHPSGKRLFELSDIVIDNHGPVGDAACTLEGLEQKVGATSTIIGSILLHQIEVDVVAKLVEAGISNVPVFYSANLDGGFEKNQNVIAGYAEQIHYRYQ